MHDERVVVRAAFGCVNLPDRFRIRGIGTEPVDGLRGKGHKSARAQRFDSAVYRFALHLPRFMLS